MRLFAIISGIQFTRHFIEVWKDTIQTVAQPLHLTFVQDLVSAMARPRCLPRTLPITEFYFKYYFRHNSCGIFPLRR